MLCSRPNEEIKIASERYFNIIQTVIYQFLFRPFISRVDAKE